MRKFLIALLISLSCACTIAAVGCADDPVASSPSESSSPSNSDSGEDEGENGAETCNVTFGKGEGYEFTSNAAGGKIEKGGALSFSLDLGGFYLNSNPQVYVNGKAVGYYNEENGKYDFSVQNVSEDLNVTVTGVTKDRSNMTGSGSMDSPFIVTQPIDLLYIAEQVNKGNTTYSTAAYILNADLDCKGAELEIIGDYSNDQAIFSGSFTCNYDSETGELFDYSISNFKINSSNVNYVGLFGTVSVNANVTSSGLFYGIRLKDFTVTATTNGFSDIQTKTLSCGSLIGYGVGATMMLCGAENGAVNVIADQQYFAYAGGLIGYQTGYYDASNGAYPSEISYADVDVDVTVLGGISLCAGGISGYLSTNNPLYAAAFVHHSYATGDVSGALRSGGVVGELGQYGVVSNCYASGNVDARATQSINTVGAQEEYCISYGGGLVGYAGNDSIVHDSFFAGTVKARAATSGEKYANKHFAVGGGPEAGSVAVNSEKYLVLDCLDSDELDLSSKEFLTNKLGWQEYDWILAADALPTINYETLEGTATFSIEVQYIAPDGTEVLVDEKPSFTYEYFNSSSNDMNMYVTIGSDFAVGNLGYYFLADENDNGRSYISFGYFFDADCTKRVPYSYLPAKDVKLYVGFADPTEVLGTYSATLENGSRLSMYFDANGTVTYSDGYSSQTTRYTYDGEQIMIDGARLARYYLGEVVIEEDETGMNTTLQDANFDMYRYMYYSFKAKLSNGVLSVCDGVYFTADAPLLLTKGALQATPAQNIFCGAWVKSATLNKTYVFNEDLTWTYVNANNPSENASGTFEYSETDGVPTYTFMQNGVRYTATLNADGALQIVSDAGVQLFYRENSYKGVWTGDGFRLELLGLTSSHIGNAVLTYSDGTQESLVYEVGETNGYVCLYLPSRLYTKGEIFGYFTLNPATNRLTATLYDYYSTTTGYSTVSLLLVDDFNGEWISNADAFLNAEFDFNGFGLYSNNGYITLTENGVSTDISYKLENGVGSFAYGGVTYTMTYDESTNTITLSAAGMQDAQLERKDVLTNISFIDLDGNTYAFDGRSSLTIGGTLTVNGTDVYGYINNDTIGGYSITNSANEIVGYLLTNGNHYELTFSGGETHSLYIANQFMGEWAVSGQYGALEIGPSDLNGEIVAKYLGHDITMTYLSPSILTFSYKDESNAPVTYYVFVMTGAGAAASETTLVLSKYSSITNDYLLCTKADSVYGEWERKDGRMSIYFDGLYSYYANYVGTLKAVYYTGTETVYSYMMREDGIIMWSQDAGPDGDLMYFKIRIVNASELSSASTAFVKGDKAFMLVKCDSMYLSVFTDASDPDVTYFFDGEGNMLLGDGNGEVVYTYKLKAFNSDNTVDIEVVDQSTGKKYAATLDRSSSIFRLGEEIVEE